MTRYSCLFVPLLSHFPSKVTQGFSAARQIGSSRLHQQRWRCPQRWRQRGYWWCYKRYGELH